MRAALQSINVLSAIGLAAALLTSCGDDCTRAGDCAADEVCFFDPAEGSRSCVPRPGIPCTSNDDCGSGAALVCEAGRCTSGYRPPDAGDLGLTDTGTITDAGTTDTGIEDTGVEDTGDAG